MKLRNWTTIPPLMAITGVIVLVSPYGITGCSGVSTSELSGPPTEAANGSAESSEVAAAPLGSSRAAHDPPTWLTAAAAPDRPAVPPLECLVTQPAQQRPAAALPSVYPLPSVPKWPAAVPTSQQQSRPLPVAEPPPLEAAWLVPGVEKPTLAVRPGVAVRSRPVELPPPLPTQGRYTPSKGGIDDPTVEWHHRAILISPPRYSLQPLPYAPVELPDPFQFSEQIRQPAAPVAPVELPDPVPPIRPR